ncbi:hypothetical protein AAJ76_590008443 [Vairimorpha ceranae]|uniref:Uncharacterized protein n=1 Tax=Vairimorpha ceranae TaxID=40302 RepID=A0A0F9YPJ5_9MICR|nr:hypothetical protein AAJ76_590008443 [Vairimorpha ceranae]KKO74567.1 hypothetical protein AAJ76_590008443 [Vairimorpha ceranae]
MKAFKKDNKIIFKDTLSKCINNLNEIVSKIEDKNNDIFPTSEISNFIKNCNQAIKESDNIQIPEDFLEFVKNKKEVLRYFTKKAEEEQEKNRLINQRKMIIKDFKNDISKFL